MAKRAKKNRWALLAGVAVPTAVAAGIAAVALGPADASSELTASRACAAMTHPVYERIDPASQASLLTTSSTEAQSAATHYGFTVNAGTPFDVSSAAGQGLVAVRRLYNAKSGDYLWTTSANEATSAVAHNGYAIVKTDFYAANVASSCDIPVYRYQLHGMHRYATTAADGAALTKAGWHSEGVGFFTMPVKATTAPKPPVSSTPVTTPSSSPTPTRSSSAPTSSKAPSSSSHPAPSSTSSHPTSSSAPPSSPGGSGPFAQPLYVMGPGTQAWSAYQAATDPTVARDLYQIASTASSVWLGGTSSDGSRVNQIETAAAAQGTTPVFVLYAIPDRDCGGYSAGGLSTVSQYDSWVNTVRAGIAGRPAVVIVEPDAIGWGCLSASQQADRISMLKYAMQTLSEDANTWVYVHAGSSGLSPTGVAGDLKQIGIQYARGFAVNVASFDTTASEIAYGKAIDAALGMNKHFVIDTGRNGMGRYTGNDGVSNSCNPPGRAVGVRPTTDTGDSLVDAFLWIKAPGGSDGSCRAGAPPAGSWYQSYAISLVEHGESIGTIVNRPLPGS